ncbi:MAG: hypothetical protein JO235_10970 [Chroococcidiopsidaceae cyanobacterium CP_BM_RX_35]|nr:hypothetical protein [Chroococcidiopsidaceae cyanobacterium CP_BM_RX_35]
MQKRLIQMGNQGFDLNAVVGWHFASNTEEPILNLYLADISKVMHFHAEEAEILQKLLTESSQRISINSLRSK